MFCSFRFDAESNDQETTVYFKTHECLFPSGYNHHEQT